VILLKNEHFAAGNAPVHEVFTGRTNGLEVGAPKPCEMSSSNSTCLVFSRLCRNKQYKMSIWQVYFRVFCFFARETFAQLPTCESDVGLERSIAGKAIYLIQRVTVFLWTPKKPDEPCSMCSFGWSFGQSSDSGGSP